MPLRCPYCREVLHVNLLRTTQLYLPPQPYTSLLGKSARLMQGAECPSCNGLLVLHYKVKITSVINERPTHEVEEFLGFVYPGPEITMQKQVPVEVPSEYADDFREASVVLPYSAKASAALSRRLLQKLLHEELNIRRADLSKEIDELIASPQLPTYIAEKVDAIRNIGNFAAHPIKSQQTGTIVDVEPDEAEWLLSIIESLFDWHFVWPERERQRKQALNAKLQAHGKPPAK